jgi:hypothetical protein
MTEDTHPQGHTELRVSPGFSSRETVKQFGVPLKDAKKKSSIPEVKKSCDCEKRSRTELRSFVEPGSAVNTSSGWKGEDAARSRNYLRVVVWRPFTTICSCKDTAHFCARELGNQPLTDPGAIEHSTPSFKTIGEG